MEQCEKTDNYPEQAIAISAKIVSNRVRHYKGDFYRILHIAKNTDNNRDSVDVVVYQAEKMDKFMICERENPRL